VNHDENLKEDIRHGKGTQMEGIHLGEGSHLEEGSHLGEGSLERDIRTEDNHEAGMDMPQVVEGIPLEGIPHDRDCDPGQQDLGQCLRKALYRIHHACPSHHPYCFNNLCIKHKIKILEAVILPPTQRHAGKIRAYS